MTSLSIARSATFLSLLVIACDPAPLRAAPVVIDDFSDDLAPITASASHEGSMLGGEADLVFLDISGTFEISSGTGVLSDVTVGTTVPNPNFQFFYDGVDGSSGHAHDLPPADLTDGGSNERFEIELNSVSGSINVQVRVFSGSGNTSLLSINGVTSAGVLEFPFADFSDIGGDGGDFAAVSQVAIFVYLDTGEEFGISSFIATGPEAPEVPEDEPTDASPDITRPTIKFINKPRLRTPRPRHRIAGTASDNDEVDRVEVKARGKGWRRAKLRASDRWVHRTPRLKPGKNVFKIRARDTNGNRSKIKRVRAAGK